MKLKGVGTLEQNVEKIVLAAASVVLLGVIATQALLQPNKVTVGKGAPVPPGQAYEPVVSRANAVKAKLDDTMPPGRPEISPQPLAAKFQDQFRAPVAPETPPIAFGMPLQVTGAEVAITQGSGQAAPLAPIAIPAPAAPIAFAQWATLDPAEVANNPDLQRLVSTEQPFDKASVSVEAVFDGTAARKALLTDPDGEGGAVRAVPTQWWAQTEIFGVRLEREELTETGEWTGLTQVAAPPARLDLVAEVTKEAVSTVDMGTWAGQAQKFAEEARRPEFYRVLAGRPWLAPADAVRLSGGVRTPEVDREFARRAKLVENRDRLQIAMEKEKGSGGGGRVGAGDDGGGGRRPAGGGNRPPAGGASQPAVDPRVANLERRLQDAEDELRKADEKIIALGFDPETGGLRVPDAAAPTGTRTASLLEDAKVRVWTHDMTAEPGKTYRYRLMVVVNNPAYGRGASMVPEQQELAKRPVIESAPSEWTAPVLVPPETAYFVTSASEGGDLGTGAGANVEVYRMFYGFYRRGDARLQPGDAVMTDVQLPKKVVLPIWDLERLKVPGAGGAGVPPPAPPGRGPDDIIVEPPGRRPANTGRPGTEPEPEQTALPEGATAWTKPIQVAVDTVLLDVARKAVATETGLGAGKARFQAFLRRPSGEIEVRVPDDERASALYQRVSASAKDGETQGAPPTPTATPKPVRPLDPTDPTGGGGGGGGG